MKAIDTRLVDALRRHLASEEERALRELSPAPDFVKQVAARIQEAMGEANEVAKHSAAREGFGESQRRHKSSSWEAMINLMANYRSALGIGLVLILGLGAFYVFTPNWIELESHGERAGPSVLQPTRFRISPAKGRITLSVGDGNLVGRMSLSNSLASGFVFSVDMRGEDDAGVEARLEGILWVTNAPGRSVIRRKGDVAGAQLRGTLTITGQLKTNVTWTLLPAP